MGGPRQQWAVTVEKLRQRRDKLKVRMHLARGELREEWETFVHKRAMPGARTNATRKEPDGAPHRILDTPLGALADQLGAACRRLRRRLH